MTEFSLEPCLVRTRKKVNLVGVLSVYTVLMTDFALEPVLFVNENKLIYSER